MIGPGAVRSGPAAIRFGGGPRAALPRPAPESVPRWWEERGDRLLQDAGRRPPAAPPSYPGKIA